jgi:hypothetical protein
MVNKALDTSLPQRYPDVLLESMRWVRGWANQQEEQQLTCCQPLRMNVALHFRLSGSSQRRLSGPPTPLLSFAMRGDANRSIHAASWQAGLS